MVSNVGLELDSFTVRLEVELRFTREAVSKLIEFATAHYDRKCNELALENGFLRVLERELAENPEVPSATWRVNDREFQTLCKVTEVILGRDDEKLLYHAELLGILARWGEMVRVAQKIVDNPG